MFHVALHLSFACAQLFLGWLEFQQLLPALFYPVKFVCGGEKWGFWWCSGSGVGVHVKSSESSAGSSSCSMSAGAGNGELVAPVLRVTFPVTDGKQSCHRVDRMWLTLNGVTEFLWFSVTVPSICYWVLSKTSGRLKTRLHLKRCWEFAERMKLSLILFLQRAKEVLTDSNSYNIW